ncbi:glycoside hydrolase 3 protein [Phytophthora pseudosyringae]|uniref:glucan endo-1,3-beta-D-glucosidase n=1 Tax=Phytophthora pseudosyringae TaxID=221518 RepID=A0A8T1VEK3_9STRA|nr:glycoside hydrolase 3 protein [Phytophthora pseudosyringae]
MLPFKLLGAIAAFTSALSVKGTAAQNFCIHGINYNPRMGPDWAPANQRCKSAASIQADMETLAKVTGSVRLFGLGDCDQSSTVVPAAINAGLSVSLGLWVSGDDAVFESEFSKLQTLIQQHATLFSGGSIVDIHVGSEAIYRKDVTAAQNIADLQRVKALLSAYNLGAVPVTIAEIGDVYLAHPELTDAVDFVQANGFPFWERIAVENAVAYFESRMAPLYQQAMARDKKVVIGETGWASDGSSPKASEASLSNAARYFSDFYHMAKQQGLEFYYFEGFDEQWKAETSNDTVEGYFGLFHEDRTLKTEIANLALGGGCVAGTNEEASASGISTGSSGSASDAYTPGRINSGSTESTGTTTTTTRPEGCRMRRS